MKNQSANLKLKNIEALLFNAGISNQDLKNFTNGTQVFIKWHIDDILERAKELKVKMTRKKAKEILLTMRSKHDATIGINWDVIDYWIDMLK